MPKTYLTKVCATCGKAEVKNWARHWKLRHPSEVINELVPGEAPSHPYDENWVYLIKDPKVKKLFRNSFKEVHSQVVPPAKISETTIEEATKLFDR
jgi:hypothetical protein